MKKSAKKLPVTKAAKAPAKKTIAPVLKTAAPAKKKASSSEPPATFISAQVDIGFGNHLTIRGEGPGLSWNEGLVMDCVGNNLWTVSIKQAAKPVIFKVLVNDLSWSAGVDHTVAPGQSITVYPTF